jgi:hypothetical protein
MLQYLMNFLTLVNYFQNRKIVPLPVEVMKEVRGREDAKLFRHLGTGVSKGVIRGEGSGIELVIFSVVGQSNYISKLLRFHLSFPFSPNLFCLL